MNKNTKLLVSVLFAVLIVLAIAVTRSYVVFPETASRDKQSEIAAIVASDDSGYIIFRSETGDLGIAQSGRISAAPEWKELSFTGDGSCIAGKKIGGKLLYGFTDYDGNVIVPMVYDKIRTLKAGDMRFYSAQCEQDGSFVLYNEELSPCFRNSWKTCTAEGSDIVVTDENGRYAYSATSDGLLFKSAEVSGEMFRCDYTLKLYSRVLLSKLSVPMINRMLSDTGKYFEYAFNGGEEKFSDSITGTRTAFQQLYGSDERVQKKKLTGISNMYIYAQNSEEGVQQFRMLVTADVEVTDTGEDDKPVMLKDRCEATITFTGSSERDLRMVSGSFNKESPDRPEERPEDKNE